MLRGIQAIVQELKSVALSAVLDRKMFLEDILESYILALLRSHIVLYELSE